MTTTTINKHYKCKIGIWRILASGTLDPPKYFRAKVTTTDIQPVYKSIRFIIYEQADGDLYKAKVSTIVSNELDNGYREPYFVKGKVVINSHINIVISTESVSKVLYYKSKVAITKHHQLGNGLCEPHYVKARITVAATTNLAVYSKIISRGFFIKAKVSSPKYYTLSDAYLPSPLYKAKVKSYKDGVLKLNYDSTFYSKKITGTRHFKGKIFITMPYGLGPNDKFPKMFKSKVKVISDIRYYGRFMPHMTLDSIAYNKYPLFKSKVYIVSDLSYYGSLDQNFTLNSFYMNQYPHFRAKVKITNPIKYYGSLDKDFSLDNYNYSTHVYPFFKSKVHITGANMIFGELNISKLNPYKDSLGFKAKVHVESLKLGFGKVTIIPTPIRRIYADLIQDTTNYKDRPNANFGRDKSLSFFYGAESHVQWTFERNDDELYKPNYEIKAYLELILTKPSTKDYTIEVHSTDGKWNEHTLTYNDKTVKDTGIIAEYYVRPNFMGRILIPLEDFLKANNKMDNFDIQLMITSPDGSTTCNSKEKGYNSPRIFYEYFVVTPNARQGYYKANVGVKKVVELEPPYDPSLVSPLFKGKMKCVNDLYPKYKAKLNIPFVKVDNGEQTQEDIKNGITHKTTPLFRAYFFNDKNVDAVNTFKAKLIIPKIKVDGKRTTNNDRRHGISHKEMPHFKGNYFSERSLEAINHFNSYVKIPVYEPDIPFRHYKAYSDGFLVYKVQFPKLDLTKEYRYEYCYNISTDRIIYVPVEWHYAFDWYGHGTVDHFRYKPGATSGPESITKLFRYGRKMVVDRTQKTYDSYKSCNIQYLKNPNYMKPKLARNEVDYSDRIPYFLCKSKFPIRLHKAKLDILVTHKNIDNGCPLFKGKVSIMKVVEPIPEFGDPNLESPYFRGRYGVDVNSNIIHMKSKFSLMKYVEHTPTHEYLTSPYYKSNIGNQITNKTDYYKAKTLPAVTEVLYLQSKTGIKVTKINNHYRAFFFVPEERYFKGYIFIRSTRKHTRIFIM